jgi:hypothetical protein
MLAAPTILNFESALAVTVKAMPGNSPERYFSYVTVFPRASTYILHHLCSGKARVGSMLGFTHLGELDASFEDFSYEGDSRVFSLLVEIYRRPLEHSA